MEHIQKMTGICHTKQSKDLISLYLIFMFCNYMFSFVFCNISKRMPFDVSASFTGYCVAYGIQLTGSAVICAIIYTINSFFFGICWYIRVLLFDLKSIFNDFNEIFKEKLNLDQGKKSTLAKNSQPSDQPNKLLESFVEFHRNIYM